MKPLPASSLLRTIPMCYKSIKGTINIFKWKWSRDIFSHHLQRYRFFCCRNMFYFASIYIDFINISRSAQGRAESTHLFIRTKLLNGLKKNRLKSHFRETNSVRKIKNPIFRFKYSIFIVNLFENWSTDWEGIVIIHRDIAKFKTIKYECYLTRALNKEK